MNKEIEQKLEENKAFIDANSNISTCVDTAYAGEIGEMIHNNEKNSDKFDLYNQPKNTELALAILDA